MKACQKCRKKKDEKSGKIRPDKTEDQVTSFHNSVINETEINERPTTKI